MNQHIRCCLYGQVYVTWDIDKCNILWRNRIAVVDYVDTFFLLIEKDILSIDV